MKYYPLKKILEQLPEDPSGSLIDALEREVLSLKEDEGTDINDAGIKAQVTYMVSRGWKGKEIEQLIKDYS